MRIPLRKHAALTTAATATAVLLAACASGSPENASRKPPSDAPIASFTYAATQWPTSLNGRTTKIATAQISTLVTQPLERFSYADGQVRFAPNLAVSVRQTDPQTVVYTLREGVKFSDGTPLSPADAVWSITAAAAPTAETAAVMQGFASAVSSGAHELTVKWQWPIGLPGLREKIAGTVEIQQAKFAQSHPDDLGTPSALPIGTGPYRYQSQTAQDIKLVPNDQYWGEKPKVQNLTFTRFTQDASAQLAMRSGSVQAAQPIDVKTAPQWEKIEGSSLYAAHDPSTSFLSMDLNTPPFDDVHVRKAIAYALDRESIAQAAFGGRADLLKGLLPAAGFTGAAPSLTAAQQFLDQLPSTGFDLGKAKAELAQSSRPHGFATTMTYSSGATWQQILLLSLQENLKQLGITLELKPVSAQEWFQTFFSHRATGIQVFPDIAILSGEVTAPLPGIVGKASMRPQMLNSANFTSPAIESAYPMIDAKTAGAYPKDRQWEATKTVLTEVANQVPYVPLFSQHNVYVAGKGFVFTTTPSFFDLLSGSWIDYVRATR